MRYQGDTSLCNSIISAALGRRNEYHIRVGGKNHFCIELSLHAYLNNPAILYTLKNILIEQVLCAGDALYHIVSIKNGKVGQLQCRHTDGITDGNADLDITIGNNSLGIAYKCKVVLLAHTDQTDIGRVSHRESCGVTNSNRDIFVPDRLNAGIISTSVLAGAATKDDCCQHGEYYSD